jgi:hypothetical protein
LTHVWQIPTTSTTNELTRRIAIAFGCQIALSSVHHIYGGFVYQSAFRLFMPFIAVGEWLVVMGLLSWYRRTRRSIALTLFSTAAALVGIVQGLVHVVYGHAYKNILFAAGIPRHSVTTFFRPLTPNDFVYPPNDIFFEGTGLLQLVTIALIARFTYCLLRKANSYSAGSKAVDHHAGEGLTAR